MPVLVSSLGIEASYLGRRLATWEGGRLPGKEASYLGRRLVTWEGG